MDPHSVHATQQQEKARHLAGRGQVAEQRAARRAVGRCGEAMPGKATGSRQPRPQGPALPPGDARASMATGDRGVGQGLLAPAPSGLHGPRKGLRSTGLSTVVSRWQPFTAAETWAWLRGRGVHSTENMMAIPQATRPQWEGSGLQEQPEHSPQKLRLPLISGSWKNEVPGNTGAGEGRMHRTVAAPLQSITQVQGGRLPARGQKSQHCWSWMHPSLVRTPGLEA